MASLFNDIELDDGDLGLIYVPGLGFRPIDGIDHYGSNKLDTPECSITAVYKDMANDQVVVERECDSVPLDSGSATRLVETNEESTFITFYENQITNNITIVGSGISTPIPFKTTPTYIYDCCDVFITVEEVVTPPVIELTPVPLLDSLLLLLSALFLLNIFKGKRT